MKRFVLESWLWLLYVDLLLHLREFGHLHRVVENTKVRNGEKGIPSTEVATLCRAVDMACVFYFKQVLCLQHSAAATLLLRRHGRKAEMVIGARIAPPKWHAWVEVEGVVVNDKPYMADIYRILKRC